MIDDIKSDTEAKMQKSISALMHTFSKVRTGRAHPSLLENIQVPYYGANAPLSQVANITVEDARTLAVRVWERQLISEIEKAILKSNLGLNPTTAGEVIRIPLPPLTEETRKGFIRQVKQEAEQGKVSIRSIRRDALASIKELEKKKEISEDDERKAQEDTQKITDRYIAEIDRALSAKEADLMEI